ncbi:T9SS C-terminal target domain-containing protein [Dyadobacter sp. Leaf189]|uniref:T9SS C-terminal target domain-containing protein n=1 Tax=Dyadobacter sp. Leaf189 TaxID=1736295 RepID=UPI000AAB1804|nr:T9SS C-terminal target domain-containing protein [Dyadobacter sp. Leaf189]
MKAVFMQKLTLAMLVISALAANNLYAQSDDDRKQEEKGRKSRIHIQVTEDENGKMKKIEKDYEVGAMTREEKDRFVEKVLDSLNVDNKKKQTISITMDDGADNTITKKRRKTIIDYRDDREPLAFNWDNNFSYDFDSEKFRNNFRNLEREIGPKAKVFMRDMEDFGKSMGSVWEKGSAKPASVRALQVYGNNPDNGTINLRFDVPVKGDVKVTVTDTRGKEVGSKEIKDFEGEFVGQVELKKNTKGTLFVTVVQNEDGAVKRIVIP